jgi:hypothetical protein
MGEREVSRKHIIFPEDVVQEAIQLSEDHSDNAWHIGDFVIKQMKILLPVYTKGEIRRGLAEISKLNVETLRDRERISLRIPPCKREYQPLLYSQYRACLSAGDRWEEYAEWAVTSMDDYNGNPPSVAVIRAKIKGENASAPEWPKRIERILDICDAIGCDKKTPAYVVAEVAKVRIQLGMLV